MKAIPFFLDTIAIVPHTATHGPWLDKPITVAEFAHGRPVSLYEHEDGELECRRKDGAFIRGPEYVAPSYSVIYLGTSLPDYFQGYGGHTYAVPLSKKPRKHEVKNGLLRCIRDEELFIDTESAPSEAYEELKASVEELFMGEHPLSLWISSADDLSESYAYFGVKVS